MAWLYVPSTVLASVQESADLNSDSRLLSETPTELFVTLSGKATQRPTSWPGWKSRPWKRLLFGMTLPPSTLDRGVALWISSLAASRANHGVMQEVEKEPRTSGGSGTILPGSFARFDPATSSWRMCQASLVGEFNMFSGTWPYSGMMLGGTCLVQKAWEPPTEESDSSSLENWTTPTSQDTRDSPPKLRPSRIATGRKTDYLGRQAAMWATPRASPNENRTTKNAPSHGGSHGMTLAGQSGNWPTPRASDQNSPGHHGDGGPDLRTAVSAWPPPKPQEGPNWPTPIAYNERGSRVQWAEDGKGGIDLKSASEAWPEKWPTPTANTSTYQRANGKTYETLPGMVKSWPTPAARDSKGPNSKEHFEKNPDRRHKAQLANFAVHGWPQPSKQDEWPSKEDEKEWLEIKRLEGEQANREEIVMMLKMEMELLCIPMPGPNFPTLHLSLVMKDGELSSPPPPVLGPRLNPVFVEWLMGLPIGWSDSLHPVTGLSQWLQRSHSLLCQLVSKMPRDEQRLLLPLLPPPPLGARESVLSSKETLGSEKGRGG